jgi:hypothetical protein
MTKNKLLDLFLIVLALTHVGIMFYMLIGLSYVIGRTL